MVGWVVSGPHSLADPRVVPWSTKVAVALSPCASLPAWKAVAVPGLR